MVMDLHAQLLGRADGPPALIDPSNPGLAAEPIAWTVREALNHAGLSPPAAAMWTGLAGAGRAGAREAVEISLRSKGLASATKVGMDAEGAHWDAFGPDPGVLLSLGTGSVIWGRDPGGGEVRVGGWGTPLGEEGSGYWLGLEGLRAVARAADGRDPKTPVTQDLLARLGISDPRELVPWVARAAKADVGALAPLVLAAAEAGDPTATAIVDAGLEALGRHLDVVATLWRPHGAPFPLALSGGLLEETGFLRNRVIALATRRGGVLHPNPVVPVRGAALLAVKLLGR